MATIVITGANRGIGLELARQLQSRGDQVIAACRTPSEAIQASGVRVEGGIDVSSADGPATLRERLGDTPVDVLINNAGILSRETIDELHVDQIRQQFEVNALGPLRVTHALRDRLGSGSKVAIITSRMGSIADNTSGSMYGYRMSKAAVNTAGVSLAHDLKPAGVAVALIHPGFVRTEMTGGQGHLEASESAALIIERIDALDMSSSGSFFHANGEILPW